MSTTPLMARRLVSGRAIAQRLAELDPVLDNEEATHLSLEVRYGDAIFAHAAYTVAFARQVAIPSIARIVYRTGNGDMMHDVRRRNDDTLLFFGEMMRHGHSSARGRAVIDRMEQIHSRFGITDDDKLYTLASLAFEGCRITDQLGLDVFTAVEREAHYQFWRGVGEYMGLTVPGTRAQFLAWTLNYETSYSYTEGGRALVDQLFTDWHTRWFPRRTRELADNILLTLFTADLRAVHRLPDPSPTVRRLVPPAAGMYLRLQATRPHRPHRSWSDHFGTRHPRPLDVPTLGHRPRNTKKAADR
ncbi:hypothetical protein NN3_19910 [Nocardia neocaledoniensis NBRC 108232]|uniref:Uncharacterized protein DUF2236 n=1 Tax=Nocardia neocaledoniensis TaxID=236511 RepID=A0A317NJ41_9NOCA|nr:oxygenase MpaB family protein [Nocardia neocaledoniensis]PWV74952.1 uncharacterized protein DUF2236 [Nocardia neocaledoniensis]GEM30984.1 hypothetical protein NN3_19910 [Nocardia neocaledoniensis NBRC 108232]